MRVLGGRWVPLLLLLWVSLLTLESLGGEEVLLLDLRRELDACVFETCLERVLPAGEER